MNCSEGHGCNCEPGDPEIGTAGYAANRRHVDAGDLDALRLITSRLRHGVAQCHVRFSDGEFMSMLGEGGENCDGQPHLSETLGLELKGVLRDISVGEGAVLVGGDWRRPDASLEWLQNCRPNFLTTIPWCPSQVFVNGILSGDLMDFLEAVKASRGRKYLVANETVGPAVNASLQARLMMVPSRNAYEAMDELAKAFRSVLNPGDVVIWAAGLGCKPTLYRMFKECPETTHLDVGCVFDGAAGLVSRGWLGGTPDAQLIEYRKRIVPWLLSKP